MGDQARGGAGREEREVIHVGGRRHRQEAGDLGTTHQELHADPGPEGKAADPAHRRVLVLSLQPVERGGRVGQLSLAAVEASLAAADAAEIEAQRREAAPHEHLVELVDDLVVHRPAVLRMRVQQQRDRGIRNLRRVVTAFEATFGAVDDDFRHFLFPFRRRGAANDVAMESGACSRVSNDFSQILDRFTRTSYIPHPDAPARDPSGGKSDAERSIS